MRSVYLVCEGHADGLDVRVLDALVAQKLDVPVQVASGGGSTSLASVRAYLEDRSRQPREDGSLGNPHDRALAVLDRDYRSAAEVEGAWTDPTTREVYWSRHEIENYLLEPRVILVTFERLRATALGKWIETLPSDLAQVDELLMQIAAPLREEHAGCLAWWDLRALVGREAEYRHPQPVRVPPARAADRDAWLAALAAEARRVRNAAGSLADKDILADDAVRRRYDEHLARVSADEFMDSRRCLADFAGKTLLTSLADHLRSLGAANLSNDDLQGALVDGLAEVYAPGLFVPDDFAALAQRLRDLAS